MPGTEEYGPPGRELRLAGLRAAICRRLAGPSRGDCAQGARLWVHGHTHQCVDYTLGSTRVLSNQRGYPREPDTGFRSDFVVEI
jgi:hypothetical protein